MAPSTSRTGDSAEPLSAEQIELYTAMLAPYVGVSFYLRHEEEIIRRRVELQPAVGIEEEKDEEYYYRLFAPSSPDAGDYYFSADEEITPPHANGSGEEAVFIGQDSGEQPPGEALSAEQIKLYTAMLAPYVGRSFHAGSDEDHRSFAPSSPDTSYEADNECDCGHARCAKRKETTMTAAAARRHDDNKAWLVVARLTAVVEHGWRLVGHALRTAAARFTAGRTPPYS